MSKQAIKPIMIITTFVLVSILLGFLAYRFYKSQESFLESLHYQLFVSDMGRQPNPNFLRDYPEDKTGSYQFDPTTIFASLDQGKDVFAAEEPNSMDTKYKGIRWTQADLLRVANALSQKVWHEPLDLDSWGVYNIAFRGNCNDDFDGFDLFDITYYKTMQTGWEMGYMTRYITLTPWMGVADWGGDGKFSAPFIFSWENIELTKFKITAEQAVQIAAKKGGNTVWMNNNNNCNVYVNIDKNVNRDTDGNWHVGFYNHETGAAFDILVDPFTGKVYSVR